MLHAGCGAYLKKKKGKEREKDKDRENTASDLKVMEK